MGERAEAQGALFPVSDENGGKDQAYGEPKIWGCRDATTVYAGVTLESGSAKHGLLAGSWTARQREVLNASEEIALSRRISAGTRSPQGADQRT